MIDISGNGDRSVTATRDLEILVSALSFFVFLRVFVVRGKC